MRSWFYCIYLCKKSAYVLVLAERDVCQDGPQLDALLSAPFQLILQLVELL